LNRHAVLLLHWRVARKRGVHWLVAALWAATMAHAQPSLNVNSTRGYPGQTAPVPFGVQRATNVVAAQFDLAYNTARGTLREPALAARHSNHVVRSREIAPGVRRVLVYSAGNALLRTNAFSGSFAFDVSAEERVGSGPITPQNVVLARGDATALVPVSARSGTVFVTPVYRDPISGLVDLFFPAQEDQRYLLQATTNFTHWETIKTNLAGGSFVDWVDEDAPRFPHRFYRTALLDALAGGHLSGLTRKADGRVSFQVTGLPGGTYSVLVSTDLTHWTPLGPATETSPGRFEFSDTAARGQPTRFYQLRSP
jgi:hypothetical protein